MSKYRCPPNCPDRSVEPNCHTTCLIYAKMREELQKIKKNRREDSLYYNYKVNSVIDTVISLDKHSKR